MMKLQEAVEFAQASAEAAFDCWRGDYATLQDAIDSHSDNVRDTLNDEHSAQFEYEAFKAFDARVALLHEHAAEDARIAQIRLETDYEITMREDSAPYRVVTLCVNGSTIAELVRAGYSLAEAQESAENNAMHYAVFEGLITQPAFLYQE